MEHVTSIMDYTGVSVGIRGTDTEVYRYKGGGLDMRTKEGLSVSVLYG